MRVAPEIVLTNEERGELAKLVRSKLTSVRLAQRARIVLLAAKGHQSKDIAAELGIGRVQVSRWRERYAQTRLAGIERDPARGERPRLQGRGEERSAHGGQDQQRAGPVAGARGGCIPHRAGRVCGQGFHLEVTSWFVIERPLGKGDEATLWIRIRSGRFLRAAASSNQPMERTLPCCALQRRSSAR